ncbi:cytochrome P450 27C1 [Trichonephila clavipes]|uniref:Cytochrome P450 27C1 n=1 Tax=Trichonephila clavipes TaxID=2585209 RepID=A0A8X6SA21_TRICX|nr:cytochrome P450 27C1 [Trichonephila clavipes]
MEFCDYDYRPTTFPGASIAFKCGTVLIPAFLLGGRLSPPIIGNGRVSQMDLVLGGYMVPAGTMVVLQSQAACMLEDYFERPLEFLPDRFVNRSKYHQVGGVNLPFGFGARFCIGQAFAHGQLILALSKPTASSTAIQAQVASSLGAPVSSRTKRRRQAEGHLGSWRPLRELPLTPTHRHLCLEWCRTRKLDCSGMEPGRF